jgi:outer membrane immunogenic protein
MLMKTRILGLLAATALTTAGISAASAADLPFRAAPPAPMIAAVPVFTWTGFYVGVNAGYGWQNNDNNSSIFVPAGTFVTAPAASGTVTFADDEGEGFVGGGQIGYNHQIGSFVFGTVRARAGVAFGQALVYATGGFAYGGADDNNDRFGLVNDDDVRTGWVLGAGMEYAFTNNLTLGLEGLWVNLNGDNNGTFIGTETTAGGAVLPVDVAGRDNDSDNEFFVARAKLNFKFSSY